MIMRKERCGWMGMAWIVAVIFLPSVCMARSESRVGLIVAFGDSLTAGAGVAIEDAYPAVLHKKIQAAGLHYGVVNAGISGETTAGGRSRIGKILEFHPTLVILELGANDGLRGLPVSEMEKNLAAIIETLQRHQIPVVLAGMKVPPNYGKPYATAFERVYPTLAARFKIPLIPFFLEGVAGHPDLNQPDGLHPLPAGYRVIVDQLWPILHPRLQ
jgi:acyl-CoA thioesterase-1